MAKHVEIISVGNELLIGKTLNTNAQWLARRITSLGLPVRRVTVIGDDVKEIAVALREAVQRKPGFIVTTGGLGPTFDDKTFEGIAEAFQSKLRVDKKALKMVEEKYAKYAEEMGHEQFELTPARVKMAKIPEDTKPLPNPVGTAPGIAMNRGRVTVFALPGVPSEMKAIFENSLLYELRAAAGNLTFFEASLYVVEVMESEMAPLIDEVMHDNPYIYIKSHPMGAEEKPTIELHLSTTAEDSKAAKKRVGRALMQLAEIVKAKGGRIKTAKSRETSTPH